MVIMKLKAPFGEDITVEGTPEEIAEFVANLSARTSPADGLTCQEKRPERRAKSRFALLPEGRREEVVEIIEKMVAEKSGTTFQEIMKATGTSKTTLSMWIKKMIADGTVEEYRSGEGVFKGTPQKCYRLPRKALAPATTPAPAPAPSCVPDPVQTRQEPRHEEPTISHTPISTPAPAPAQESKPGKIKFKLDGPVEVVAPVESIRPVELKMVMCIGCPNGRPASEYSSNAICAVTGKHHNSRVLRACPHHPANTGEPMPEPVRPGARPRPASSTRA